MLPQSVKPILEAIETAKTKLQAARANVTTELDALKPKIEQANVDLDIQTLMELSSRKELLQGQMARIDALEKAPKTCSAADMKTITRAHEKWRDAAEAKIDAAQADVEAAFVQFTKAFTAYRDTHKSAAREGDEWVELARMSGMRPEETWLLRGEFHARRPSPRMLALEYTTTPDMIVCLFPSRRGRFPSPD